MVMHERNKKLATLYVYRNGLAVVRSVPTPPAAIEVARGDREVLKSCLTAGCRLAYNGKQHFVNGIYEDTTSSEAIDALVVFSKRVKRRLAGGKFFEAQDAIRT